MRADTDRIPALPTDDDTDSEPDSSGSGDEFASVSGPSAARIEPDDETAQRPQGDRLATVDEPSVRPKRTRQGSRKRPVDDADRLPARDPDEDVFEYMRRPDVQPRIIRTALRLIRDDGSRASAVTFTGAPTRDEVLAHPHVTPGSYHVQLYQSAPNGGQPCFATADRRYYLDARLFEEPAPTPAAPTLPAPAPSDVTPPANDRVAEFFREQAERSRADLEREREARFDLERKLEKLAAQLQQPEPRAPQPPGILELLQVINGSGGAVEHAKLRQEHDDGYQRGYRAGLDAGRVKAWKMRGASRAPIWNTSAVPFVERPVRLIPADRSSMSGSRSFGPAMRTCNVASTSWKPATRRPRPLLRRRCRRPPDEP